MKHHSSSGWWEWRSRRSDVEVPKMKVHSMAVMVLGVAAWTLWMVFRPHEVINVLLLQEFICVWINWWTNRIPIRQRLCSWHLIGAVCVSLGEHFCFLGSRSSGAPMNFTVTFTKTCWDFINDHAKTTSSALQEYRISSGIHTTREGTLVEERDCRGSIGNICCFFLTWDS